MTFRVDYSKTFNHGDFIESGGGTLNGSFETYEEAAKHVEWAKKHLIHDRYEIVERPSKTDNPGFKKMQEMKRKEEKQKQLIMEMLVDLEEYMSDKQEFECLTERIKSAYGIDYRVDINEYMNNDMRLMMEAGEESND